MSRLDGARQITLAGLPLLGVAVLALLGPGLDDLRFVASLALLIATILVSAWTHLRLAGEARQGHSDARLATHCDPVSGLPNQFAALEELTAIIESPSLQPFAVAYVDADGFAAVNDTYDHETGDRLMRAVAEGFTTLANGNASVAKLSGDDFCVVVTGEGARQRIEALAIHILAFVREPFDLGGRTAIVGASIGLVEGQAGQLDSRQILRRAELAMTDARAHGRNQYRWFDFELSRRHAEDLDIAREMAKILARGEFEVAYQPIVDSATRRINAVEALARWPRGSQRQLSPERFIPIAESHGLIDQLGSQILRKACRDIAQWQDIRLSINASTAQLGNPGFVRGIEKIVAQSGFSLDRLEVEFTETVLIRNTDRAREVIGELHRRGVTVALDDFGTGFASVGYLRTFNFDKIKLDKSLTQSIMTNVAAQKVVQGTVLIADGLAAEIIAEGIETEEEAQLMRLSGCHQLQGYYFSRPVAAAAIGAMLPASQDERILASA